jgi:hypothetical protein
MLKFHQATYDLLTSEYIDPKRAIDVFEQYEAPLMLNHYKDKGEEFARQKLEEHRNKVLSWTKLELHKRPVTFSQANIDKLDALETKYQVKLPESVREWYSLDICPEIMSLSHGSYVHHKDIEEFSPLSELTGVYQNKSRPDLWYFYFAEYIDQGGDIICFQTQQGDNPPVFAEYARDYKVLKPSFSEFIYMHFWLFRANYCFPYSFYLRSINNFLSMISPSRYWILLARMSELFTNSLSGKLHFYDEQSRILGHPEEKIENNLIATVNDTVLAGGHFRAKTIEAIENLIIRLWGNDAPLFHMESDNLELIALLNSLRQVNLRQVFETRQDWISYSEMENKFGLSSNSSKYSLTTSLDYLISLGEIEAHPENDTKRNPENRYRLKPRHEP